MAPSILASSRSLVAENPTLSSKPPVQTSSTTGPSPSTIRAPVLPRSIRSRPSRSGVPGASAARAAQRRSSRPLSVGDTEPPEVAGHGQCIHARRDVPVARPAGSGSLGRLARLSGLTWPRGSAGRVVLLSGPSAAECKRDGLPDGLHLLDVDKRRLAVSSLGARQAARAGGHNGPAESHPLGLGQPSLDPADPPYLTGQADLSDRDQAARRAEIGYRAGQGQRDSQVNGRLGQPHPADGRRVHVLLADLVVGPPL